MSTARGPSTSRRTTGSRAPGAPSLPEGVLRMRIDGTSDAVERFERVVGSHLARFGARDGLVVQWQRDNGPGQSFMASDPDAPSR